MARYIQSAELFLQSAVTAPFSIRTSASAGKLWVPQISQILALRKKWQQPKEKREPYTLKLFQALAHAIDTQCKTDITAPLTLYAAVFDWIRLGIFTGSRIGEYAQSIAKKGEYSRIPNSPAAGEWANYPVAFIAADFTFFNHNYCRLSHAQLHKAPSTAYELHIRYRFDKSARNFTIKKYRRGESFLCPIDAAISILRRAFLLQVPVHAPIGVYSPKSSARSFTYLRDSDVVQVVREACVLAYPDPNHYLRININNLVSHSNRVTAAVALRAAKLDIPAIAARLRWHPATVDHYLRETDDMLDDFTKRVTKGALLI